VDPHITVLSLGVDDLEASLRFYRDGLGFETPGIVGDEAAGTSVAFIRLQAGLTLALYPRASIARDAGIEVSPRSSTEMTLGHNVASPAAVDAVIEQARAAGALLVDEGRQRAWGGYSGHFQDPDGHLWEIVYNPDFPA
jgi:uncharacterized protein